MPFVSSVRPSASRPVSTIKKRAETLASSETKPSRNVTRFGNGDKEPGKLKLMFQNAFNPKSLMRDGVWGIGMSIVAALIPPHAPALLMLPAAFAVGITCRSVSALLNPTKVAKTLQPAAR